LHLQADNAVLLRVTVEDSAAAQIGARSVYIVLVEKLDAKTMEFNGFVILKGGARRLKEKLCLK
jgi:hypothetical protein